MTVLSVIRVTRPPDQSHPNWAKRISPSTVIWVNWVPFFTIFLLFISVSFLSFAIFTVATKQKKRNESQCLICQFCILRCWLSRPLFAKSLNSYSRKSYRKKQRKQKKKHMTLMLPFWYFPSFLFSFSFFFGKLKQKLLLLGHRMLQRMWCILHSSQGGDSGRTRVPRRRRQSRQLDLHRPVQSRTARVRLLASPRSSKRRNHWFSFCFSLSPHHSIFHLILFLLAFFIGGRAR